MNWNGRKKGTITAAHSGNRRLRGFKVEMKQWERDLNKNKQKNVKDWALANTGISFSQHNFVSEIVEKG